MNGRLIRRQEGERGTARQSRSRMEDRQNHGGTESRGTKTESGLADHSRRGHKNLLFMILSRHDSVGPPRWPKDSSQLANKLDYCVLSAKAR
jgi:hypothetical protein